MLVPLLWVLPSCGGGLGSGEIRPRYRAATGSVIRYQTVLRTLPAGRPGRTVSAATRVSVRRTDDAEVFDVSVRYGPVHVAGEGGSMAEEQGHAVATFRRDVRRRLVSDPVVEGDVEAAHELARLLREDVIFPDGTLRVGDTWSLPAVERPLPGEGTVSIERTARLEEVANGVARIIVSGESSGASVERAGVQLAVEATIEQTIRVRVADAVLIELESESEVRIRSETGSAVHRERAEVRRVMGTAPGPEAHDWRSHVDASCQSRLRAMRQRFERAPQNIDLDRYSTVAIEVPVRPSGQPIDEAGPILVGIDEETILGSAAAEDVQHTVVTYAVAPVTVTDTQLAGWLESVIAPGIEVRRIVQGQVHPPSPAQSGEVVALERRMRESHSVDVWNDAVRALVVLCDEAYEAFELAQMSEPHARGTQLREGILRAYERCGCESTDLPRLERTLDLRLGGPELGWEPLHIRRPE